MEKSDKAVELFKGGLCCSQAVFCAFAEDFGMDAETARKVSAGLGGGVGRMREVCSLYRNDRPGAFGDRRTE